jgi:hypothetical protein
VTSRPITVPGNRRPHRPWAGLAGFALLLSACARQPDPAGLAWWIEDRAHGIPRRVAELEGPNPPGHRLLTYLRNTVEADGSIRPPLRRRAERQPALAAALAAGDLVITEGEVAPSPKLVGAARRTAETLADGENADRRALDVIVIDLGGLDPLAAQAYLSQVRTIRARLDADAGGRTWTTSR